MLYPIKIENPILSFFIWNFFISVFLKEKNLIISLITYIAVFDCLLILFARERFPWKKQSQAKIGPFAFIRVHKLSLHDKLFIITINYELCITKHITVVRFFIDPDII